MQDFDDSGLASIAGTPGKEARVLAALGHAIAFSGLFTWGVGSLLGPLLVWAAYRDVMPFVGGHAREALNFNLTVLLVCAVLAVPALVIFGAGLLFVPLILIVVFCWLILTFFAMLKAGLGLAYRYPFALRLIR
ncbi:MAG: DUF4870 domain-containing protein [Pseudoxanthomonas spadix]|nr:MAG: DUF4870 domain-containing protein [Pseudoxanthomonas spadix]